MKLKRVLLTASLAAFLLASGCGDDFEEAPISTIQDEMKESREATAVSWWYLGERDGYHYLVIKRPLDQRRYKIKSAVLSIALEYKEPTFNESEWVNLKFSQVEFGHQN